MKKMRVLSILLIIVMLMAACAKKEENPEPEKKPAVKEEQEEAEEADSEYADNGKIYHKRLDTKEDIETWKQTQIAETKTILDECGIEYVETSDFLYSKEFSQELLGTTYPQYIILFFEGGYGNSSISCNIMYRYSTHSEKQWSADDNWVKLSYLIQDKYPQGKTSGKKPTSTLESYVKSGLPVNSNNEITFNVERMANILEPKSLNKLDVASTEEYNALVIGLIDDFESIIGPNNLDSDSDGRTVEPNNNKISYKAPDDGFSFTTDNDTTFDINCNFRVRDKNLDTCLKAVDIINNKYRDKYGLQIDPEDFKKFYERSITALDIRARLYKMYQTKYDIQISNPIPNVTAVLDSQTVTVPATNLEFTLPTSIQGINSVN